MDGLPSAAFSLARKSAIGSSAIVMFVFLYFS